MPVDIINRAIVSARVGGFSYSGYNPPSEVSLCLVYQSLMVFTHMDTHPGGLLCHFHSSRRNREGSVDHHPPIRN
jgi:hypothetical protein